ncbi:MAG: hypothetical protein R6V83_02715 [Candidatus Thorarchaeota archaeon]
MYAEDDSESDWPKPRQSSYDPLLDSYSEGLRSVVLQKYTNLRPIAKTMVKYLLVLAFPLALQLDFPRFEVAFIFGTVSFRSFMSFWETTVNLYPLVYGWLFVVSLPSLWISYLRDRNPERQISLKRAGMALLLTVLLSDILPIIATLLMPSSFLTILLPYPAIHVMQRGFSSVPVLLLVVLPQIIQWTEHKHSESISIGEYDHESLDFRRLSYFVFILLFFAPFQAILYQYYADPYHLYPVGFSTFGFLSFCLVMYMSFGMSLQLIIPPLYSMGWQLLIGFPRLFFAYRLIKYLTGTETRKRTLRLGILSIAWSLLIFSLISHGLSFFSHIAYVYYTPIPVPILFILGLVALYRPHKLGFLFTEQTQKERKIESRREPRRPVESRPEELTVPLTYLIRSKIATSRLNVWCNQTGLKEDSKHV